MYVNVCKAHASGDSIFKELHNALCYPALCDILYSAVCVLVYFLVSNGILQCNIGGLYWWQNDGDAGRSLTDELRISIQTLNVSIFH